MPARAEYPMTRILYITCSGDSSAGPRRCPYECYRSLPAEATAALERHLYIVLGETPPPTHALTFIPKADAGHYADNFRMLDMPDTAARIMDSPVFANLMHSFCPVLHQSQALVSALKEAPANYLAIQDALWARDSGSVVMLTDMAKAFERVNPGWLLGVLTRLCAPHWVRQYAVHLLYGRKSLHHIQGFLLPALHMRQGLAMVFLSLRQAGFHVLQHSCFQGAKVLSGWRTLPHLEASTGLVSYRRG